MTKLQGLIPNSPTLWLSIVAATLFLYYPVSCYWCDTKNPMEMRSSIGKVIIKEGICDAEVYIEDLQDEPEIIFHRFIYNVGDLFTLMLVRKNIQRPNYTLHWMVANIPPLMNSLSMSRSRDILKAYDPPVNSTASYYIVVYNQTDPISSRHPDLDVNNFDPKVWESLFVPHVKLFSNVTFRTLGTNKTYLHQTAYNHTSHHQHQHPHSTHPPVQHDFPPYVKHNTFNGVPTHIILPPQNSSYPSSQDSSPSNSNLPIHHVLLPQEPFPSNIQIKPTNPPPFNPQIHETHLIATYSNNFSHPSNFSNQNHSSNYLHYNTSTVQLNNTNQPHSILKVHNKNAGVNVNPSFQTLTLISFISILSVSPNL